MDKKRGLINVVVSLAFKVILLVGSIYARRCLINYAGNEINGLNSLYMSILDFLAVAELGVGSAITFCMYGPIVNGDKEKVSALYHLFTKLYLVIGSIILIGGWAIMPALPLIAKDYQSADANLYITFALAHASVVLTYVYSSKTSLINAHKSNYVTTTITSIAQITQYVAQSIVLILTNSFIGFLLCRIGCSIIQWAATEIYTRVHYKDIITKNSKVDTQTKKDVTKNIKAMFMHKIGSVLVNTADSLIISAFIGVEILGKYSNYTTIVVAMTSVISLLFTPLVSVIGHMFAEKRNDQAIKYLDFFHTLNFAVGVIFFMGYYATIDDLVTLLFGSGLELAKTTSFIITVNYFIQFMRQAVLLFRDATGTFYRDRWKPLCEGVLNIALSIGFVFLFENLWGPDFAVVGVIVATIITNLTICYIVEPHVLYKYALKTSAKSYYLKSYLYSVIFIVLLISLHFSMIQNRNQWIELFANAGISLAYSLVVATIVALTNKDLKFFLKTRLSLLKRIRIECQDAKANQKQASKNEDNEA